MTATSCFALQVWYGVPASATAALEEAMRDALPHLFESNPRLLYQLVTMLSPTELQVKLAHIGSHPLGLNFRLVELVC